jgi:hypothetical protein
MKNLNDKLLKKMILQEMHHTMGDNPYTVHEGDMCEGGCGHPSHGEMEVIDADFDSEMQPEEMESGGLQDVELDYEGEMSKSNLYHLAKNATMLHNILEDDTNLEPWVQEKIAIANSMIKSVTDYMEYQTLKKK